MNANLHPTAPDQAKARTTIGIFGSHWMANYQTSVLEGAVDAAREYALNLIAYSGGEIESTKLDNINLNVIYKLATSHNMDALLFLTTALMVCVDNSRKVAFTDQYAVPKISLESSLPNIPGV